VNETAPIAETIAPIIANSAICKPVTGHPLFVEYVAELMRPIPSQGSLNILEGCILASTGQHEVVLRTLGRVAAEMALNARHCA
jgi:hypothetical protein